MGAVFGTVGQPAREIACDAATSLSRSGEGDWGALGVSAGRAVPSADLGERRVAGGDRLMYQAHVRRLRYSNSHGWAALGRAYDRHKRAGASCVYANARMRVWLIAKALGPVHVYPTRVGGPHWGGLVRFMRWGSGTRPRWSKPMWGHTDLLVGQAALGRACSETCSGAIKRSPEGRGQCGGILTYWWVRPHWGGFVTLHCGGNENVTIGPKLMIVLTH